MKTEKLLWMFALSLAAVVAFSSCGGGDTSDEPASGIDGDADDEEASRTSTDDTNTGTGTGSDADYPAGPYGKVVGETMENLALADCEGNQVSLKDYYPDAKAILISHSAGWCNPCRAEAPTMQGWYEKYKDQGFVILLPLYQNNSYQPADAEFCVSWRDQYNQTFPVLLDPENLLGPYHPDFPTTNMPLNIMLNKDMKITFINEGEIPPSIEDQIKANLGL